MDISDFTAQLDAIRREAINVLFRSISPDIDYVVVTVENGEVWDAQYFTPNGEIYSQSSTELWPLTQVFGHHLDELGTYTATASSVPEHVRRAASYDPNRPSGTARIFVRPDALR